MVAASSTARGGTKVLSRQGASSLPPLAPEYRGEGGKTPLTPDTSAMESSPHSLHSVYWWEELQTGIPHGGVRHGVVQWQASRLPYGWSRPPPGPALRL